MDIVSDFAMPVVAKDAATFEKYKKRFIDAQVEIRPIIAGDMSKQPFYKKYVQGNVIQNENADFLHKNGFYFPNNPELTADEIELLCLLLKK
jgi:CDP-6-deoxy-D-xylo-4-hexulose-3-dehydrase